jgi:hypothetical protein
MEINLGGLSCENAGGSIKLVFTDDVLGQGLRGAELWIDGKEHFATYAVCDSLNDDYDYVVKVRYKNITSNPEEFDIDFSSNADIEEFVSKLTNLP